MVRDGQVLNVALIECSVMIIKWVSFFLQLLIKKRHEIYQNESASYRRVGSPATILSPAGGALATILLF